MIDKIIKANAFRIKVKHDKQQFFSKWSQEGEQLQQHLFSQIQQELQQSFQAVKQETKQSLHEKQNEIQQSLQLRQQEELLSDDSFSFPFLFFKA